MNILYYKNEPDIDLLKKYYLDNLTLEEILRKEYGYGEFWYKVNEFNLIRNLLNDDFEGKRILDLGCGSNKISDDAVYEPWLDRALYEKGAKIIGIDINDNGLEKFENYRVDLSKENSLNFLQSNSIDLAYSFSFFDAPALTNPKKTFNYLIPQLNRILKKDAFFIFNNAYFINEFLK